MAPGSGRSGGKILKEKRIANRKTPYDRPTPPQPQQPLLQPEESPSWLTGLVSPAKFVAGGASKIISSIWNPKSWAEPSSTSSDSDIESDDSGDDENPSDGVMKLSKKSSQKSETLHLIEQLLVHEHFSREECDRLIEIINSRAVDYSHDAGPSMIHSSTNNETSDIHNQAIMEAKKWVAENKVKSGLISELDNGIFALKSVMTPQATEKEAGSPVDVAKSYMKARPPWASPLNNDKSLTTPSPLAADMFKERTSFSSAKKDYLSAGSWNIQDEIRRVRTKATEDLLNSHRSVKLALSANETSIIAAGRNEAFKSVDEVVNLAVDGSDPILSDMMASQNDLATEALHSNPAMPALEQYQGINQNGVEKKQDSKQPDIGLENDSTANDIVQADNNCFFMTESPDIPAIINSQDSFNNNTNEQSQTTKKKDDVTETPAATRASRSTRRAKGRGK